jgi:uncharacterized protein (TIGR03083 family)
MDIWPAVHTERRALAADLRDLGTEDWGTPSLCDNWTVRDVLAHMTSAAKLTPPAFFGKMIGSGFSFDKVQEKGVAANLGASPADTLANFESVVTSVKHPPGPTQTWLGETIVHSEDIRRALGIQHKYPADAVVTVADFYKGSRTCSSARRTASTGSPCGPPTPTGATAPAPRSRVRSCRWSWR